MWWTGWCWWAWWWCRWSRHLVVDGVADWVSWWKAVACGLKCHGLLLGSICCWQAGFVEVLKSYLWWKIPIGGWETSKNCIHPVQSKISSPPSEHSKCIEWQEYYSAYCSYSMDTYFANLYFATHLLCKLSGKVPAESSLTVGTFLNTPEHPLADGDNITLNQLILHYKVLLKWRLPVVSSHYLLSS